MFKLIADFIGIVIFVAFCVFVGYFLHFAITQENKCTELGGAYIKGHCLKVETIKL